MTRKDYILIAAALKAVTEVPLGGTKDYAIGAAAGIAYATRELASRLGRDNPRFDRERFLKAAGVQS